MSNKWLCIVLVSGLVAGGAGCWALAPAQENPVVVKAPAPSIRPLPPAKPQQPQKPTAPETQPAQSSPSPAPVQTQLSSPMPSSAIDRALAKKVAVDLTTAPLSEFIAEIKRQTDLEIRIAPDALTPKDVENGASKGTKAEKPPEESPEKSPQKTEKPSEKPAEPFAPKTDDQLPEKPSDKPASPADKGSEKTPDGKLPELKTPELKTPDGKTPKSGPDGVPVKPADPPPEKADERAADKSPAADSANSEKPETEKPPVGDKAAGAAPATDASELVITVHLKAITAASALDLVLRDVGLSWTVDHGGILIAQPDQLPPTMAVYDVRDLVVAHPSFDTHDDSVELDYDPLVNLITGVIQCPAWAGDVDKVQDCNPFHGTLTVHQDQQVQQKVAGLLAALRRARDLSPSQYTPSTNLGLGIGGADDSAVAAALDANVNAKFAGAKLDEIATWIRSTAGIPVHIDSTVPQATEDDQAFTLKATGVSLRAMLKSLLPQGKLTFSVADETLVITSQDAVSDLRTIRVYPVGDLIGGDIDQHGIDDDYAQLLDSITHNVEPDSWATLDRQKPSSSTGNAYAAYLPAGRAIVIDQSSSAHEEIAAVLEKLRTAVAAQPASKRIADSKLPGKTADKAEPQPKRYYSMRIYKLNPDLPADDFVAVVHDLIEPKSWTGDAYLHGVPGAIVVKQTPAMHKRVERLLIELGAIPDPKKSGASGTPILVGHQKRT